MRCVDARRTWYLVLAGHYSLVEGPQRVPQTLVLGSERVRVALQTRREHVFVPVENQRGVSTACVCVCVCVCVCACVCVLGACGGRVKGRVTCVCVCDANLH